MRDDWRIFHYTHKLAAAFEMYGQGGLQGCLSSPEVVGTRDPGQAAPFLMRDSLADKGRCDRPLACPSLGHQGAGEGAASKVVCHTCAQSQSEDGSEADGDVDDSCAADFQESIASRASDQL